jgi:hypothetical protein
MHCELYGALAMFACSHGVQTKLFVMAVFDLDDFLTNVMVDAPPNCL